AGDGPHARVSSRAAIGTHGRPPMRALGATGLQISRIGCGGWQFGGGELPGPRPAADDARRRATLAAALDTGINWIDTAAVYGLGHSETLVAQTLARRG